MEADVM